MKRITFTRAIAPSRIRMELFRENYPGYLVTVSNLPGIEFVIAKGSATHPDGQSWYFLTGQWLAFERESGLSIATKTTQGGTRTECYEKLIALLCRLTPEKFEVLMEDRRVRRMTALLKGETP